MFNSKKPAASSATSLTTTAPYDRSKSSGRMTVVPSIISADTTVSGDVQSAGEVHVEGSVVGNINVSKLVITEGGSVTGDIAASEVRICGTLTGAVRSKQVTLAASSRVTGDVYHEVLAIEAGARLEGQCRRLAPVVIETASEYFETMLPTPANEEYASAALS
ncbi:MAG: polymer-forming cytoskeletal protein [Acidocella sp.]|nr:polymer-forming cytoskeletal protein [Acidocella sp.]